jgi:hypothetical protein
MFCPYCTDTVTRACVLELNPVAGSVKLFFYTMLAEVVHSRPVAILKTA